MIKYNPIGYQVVDMTTNDIHPHMDASFCIYSRKQALEMLSEINYHYILLPIKEGDIEEPTFMFEGDPETAGTEIVVTQTPTVVEVAPSIREQAELLLQMMIEEEEVEVAPRFRELAELLLQMMIEGQEFEVADDFEMPEHTILMTAKALERGFLNGRFSEDENGALYYSGMTEDYGGYYETMLDIAQNETQQEEDSITVFKNKLEAFAKAAEELNNAWDYVNGEPEVKAAIDIPRYPFNEKRYDLALGNIRNWAKKTAENLNNK